MDTVCLVTCRKLPELTPSDRLFFDALEVDGWKVDIAIWDDPAVDWGVYRAMVLRSTWDYYQRPKEFLRWLSRCQATGTRLYNSPELVEWNYHKSYLEDLVRRGFSVVPTKILQRGESYNLPELLEAWGWNEVVVKPAISATAHRTFRTSRGEAADIGEQLERWLQDVDFLVQPFIPEIVSSGEISCQFFAGQFSHAVVKRAKAGDYRVQMDFGGTTELYEPSASTLAQARRIAEAIPQPWLYARIDGVEVGGEFVVMEVELIEPELFFQYQAGAAGKMAAALRKLVT